MHSRPPMAASPSTLTEADEVCVAQPVSCTRCHAHFIMPSCRSLGCLPEAISRQGCQQSRHLRRGTFDLHLDGLNDNLFPVVTSICDIRRQPSQQLPDRRAVNFATSNAPSCLPIERRYSKIGRPLPHKLGITCSAMIELIRLPSSKYGVALQLDL